MKIKTVTKTQLILDFDCEARPLSWYAGDFTSKEITAIAACFIGQQTVKCWVLGELTLEEILQNFVKLYNKADIVTGHYIRKFDLPLINTMLLEVGMPPLSSKLTHDTHGDLVKKHGASNSQENLAALLGTDFEKIGMTQEDWREANRLTTKGIAKTKKRAIGDVRQHMEMRQKLIDKDALGPAKIWKPYGRT